LLSDLLRGETAGVLYETGGQGERAAGKRGGKNEGARHCFILRRAKKYQGLSHRTSKRPVAGKGKKTPHAIKIT